MLLFSKFIKAIKENILFIIFLIYIFYVNISWLIVTESTSFIVYTLFYLFNVLLFYSTYLLYQERFITNENIRNAIFGHCYFRFYLCWQVGQT